MNTKLLDSLAVGMWSIFWLIFSCDFAVVDGIIPDTISGTSFLCLATAITMLILTAHQAIVKKQALADAYLIRYGAPSEN